MKTRLTQDTDCYLFVKKIPSMTMDNIYTTDNQCNHVFRRDEINVSVTRPTHRRVAVIANLKPIDIRDYQRNRDTALAVWRCVIPQGTECEVNESNDNGLILTPALTYAETVWCAIMPEEKSFKLFIDGNNGHVAVSEHNTKDDALKVAKSETGYRLFRIYDKGGTLVAAGSVNPFCNNLWRYSNHF